MKSIEKATNNMKMVYSILCNLKKCTIFVFTTDYYSIFYR